MANVFIQDSTMSAIGDAIRAKTGGTAKILPADMATEIAAIETGSDIQLIEGMEIPLDFSAGDQSLAAPDGYAVKTATIKQPATLLPKNIANGVNIAGVVGTLVSGGGDSGGGGGLKIATTFNGSGSTSNAATPAKVKVTVPTEAIDVSVIQADLVVAVYNSSYATITENHVTLKGRAINPADMVETDLGTGYKTMEYQLETFPSLSNAFMYSVQDKNYKSILCYTMPNLTYKDNILYAGANCVRLHHHSGAAGRHIPLYIEGVDMRGSAIEGLRWGDVCGMAELKKVWLSETTTSLERNSISYNSNLEEIHFTSTTPPNFALEDSISIPTTCKIYVPAGTLSAYTSAEYYPSASTYTYIEE